jgi:hypothetical protein
MSNPAKHIPVPAKGSINSGLSSPHNSSVIPLLGLPTEKKARDLRVTMDVGPFRATGLKPFLELLKKIFEKVKKERPDLYNAVKTAGCFNIRPQRGTTTVKSNHSWGIAIDLYFGDEVTPRGSGLTEQGLLDLYPYFHNELLYWGAEFGVDDAMHIEASLQLLLKWNREGKI